MLLRGRAVVPDDVQRHCGRDALVVALALATILALVAVALFDWLGT